MKLQYSLWKILQEVRRIKNWKFDVGIVRTSDNGISHVCNFIRRNGDLILFDASKDVINPNYKIHELIEEKNILAFYYEQAASSYLYHDDLENAKKFILRSLALNPYSSDAWCIYSEITLQEWNLERAEKFARTALKLREWSHPYRLIGYFLDARGREKEAKMFLNKAAQLELEERWSLGCLAWRRRKSREDAQNLW